MTLGIKIYSSEEEIICNKMRFLKDCTSCKKSERCFVLREQLEFYKYLGIQNIEKKFNDIILSQKIGIPDSLKIKNNKKRIDRSWNYQGKNTKIFTHGFHTYPAMMIPQIAGRLIDMFAKERDVVLDPFCGSGSVLVEAKLRGLKCYGIDINPLARLIAKVKTTPIKVEYLREKFKKFLKNYEKEKDKEIICPSFFNIDFWFKPKVIYELAVIKKLIDKIEDNNVKDFFKVVFSETVRDVSNTRNDEFKLYRISKEELENFNPDVLSTFIEKTERNISGMESFLKNCKKLDSPVIILDEDTRYKT
ncbi:MAG: TRM11 family SAM-dependent methyltransferase, partial [Endomicrobiia bacterium]